MKTIGVTGRIGSGKTTFCQILSRRYGCEVIDGDQLGHEALESEAIRSSLVTRFGVEILDDAGRIVRARLGRLVFARKDRLAELNDIVHPWILEAVHKRLDALRALGTVGIVLIDAALLLDYTDRIACDSIVLVRCTEATAIERLRLRGLTEEEARSRAARQKEAMAMEHRVDTIVDNDGDLLELEMEAARLWEIWNRKEG